MITGHERQEATGGAWQLWLPWYCFFALYAPCEIGFTAWISPYATIFGLAVDCEEVSKPAIFLQSSQLAGACARARARARVSDMMVGRGVPSLRARARARSIASTGRRSRQRCSPHATTFPSRSRAWEASSSPSTSPPSRSTLHHPPPFNVSKVGLIETVLTPKFLRPALPRLLHRRDPLGKPHRRDA